jgi:signal transduction histidine kinase
VAHLLGRDPRSGAAAAIFESDSPLSLAELSARFSISQDGSASDQIHSGLFAPIRSRQRPLGIIAVGYFADHVFSANERQLIAVAGQQLGVAVENARLISNLQSALERVREANRVKDEFLAVVSHELRTPLTAIQGWSEVLQDPEVEREQLYEGLDAIHYASASLTQLISDLLDLSRIEHNVMRLETQPIDPNYPVRAAVSTTGQIAESKGVDLHVDLAESLPLVMADPGRMQQVIWNLLVNAIKFTPAGGNVWVSTALAGTSVHFTVKDDGTGISSDFLPHVFDRFTQADGSPTRQFGGLGLGLSLVRSLVEAHGGKVVASSDGKGLGATFVVAIPILEAAAS